MPAVRRSRVLTVTAGAAVLAAACAVPAGAVPRPHPAVASAAPAAAAPPTRLTAEERRVPASVVPRLRWGSCGTSAAGFQCATARVPLDYDHPHGQTITLALTRLPASDPAHRVGSLFTNPGGPGGSGVDFVQQSARTFYPASVRARFDIVGFDPRGVARSTPATCFPTAAQEQAFTASALPYPRTTAEERRFDRETRQLAASCAASSPTRFRHMSTANVARDLDLLRRAVGDTRLSYAGYSYGTFLGATYARLFPHRVRALALDGTIDPRRYSGTAHRYRRVPLALRIGQDRGGADVFGEFLRLCRAAGPSRCSLAGLGDPATVARQTLDQLKQQPAVVIAPDGSTTTITYQVAVALTYFALYDASGWTDLANLLTLLHRSGASAAPVRAPAAVAALLTHSRATAAARGEDYASVGGAVASTCVDATTPPRRVYPGVADARDRRYPDFGRFRTWTDDVCTYLKQEGIRDADAYRGPWRHTTAARVLVLGVRHDPATPYDNTRPYARLFPRASVVTVQGWGHTALLSRSRCADARVAAYLLHPEVRRGDLTCATGVRPFDGSATSAAERATARALLPVR